MRLGKRKKEAPTGRADSLSVVLCVFQSAPVRGQRCLSVLLSVDAHHSFRNALYESESSVLFPTTGVQRLEVWPYYLKHNPHRARSTGYHPCLLHVNHCCRCYSAQGVNGFSERQCESFDTRAVMEMVCFRKTFLNGFWNGDAFGSAHRLWQLLVKAHQSIEQLQGDLDTQRSHNDHLLRENTRLQRLMLRSVGGQKQSPAVALFLSFGTRLMSVLWQRVASRSGEGRQRLRGARRANGGLRQTCSKLEVACLRDNC